MFLRNTVLVAAVAWSIGMLPSTLSAAEPAQASAGPELLPMALMIIAFGALGGTLIGLVQWFALRRIPGSSQWIPATAVGWALGLPLDFLGAMLPDEKSSRLFSVLCGTGFGLLAGAVVALPTGWVLLRLALGGSETRAASHAISVTLRDPFDQPRFRNRRKS